MTSPREGAAEEEQEYFEMPKSPSRRMIAVLPEKLDAYHKIADAAYDFCDDRRFDPHLKGKGDFVQLVSAVRQLLEVESEESRGPIHEGGT